MNDETKVLMYGQTDDDEAKPERVDNGKAVQAFTEGKYVVFSVDGKTFRVPSTSYVSSLERTIEKQERQIKRLDAAIKAVKNTVRSQASDISATNKELARKINARP